MTTLTTTKGSLFSIAVPAQLPPTGLVWRVARPVNGRVVSQVGEGEIAGATVLVFRVVGKGKAIGRPRADEGRLLAQGDLCAVRYSITAR